MSLIAPLDAKKLVEALLGDLRQLSTEAKKKHNHVKEVHSSIACFVVRTLEAIFLSSYFLKDLKCVRKVRFRCRTLVSSTNLCLDVCDKGQWKAAPTDFSPYELSDVL